MYEEDACALSGMKPTVDEDGKEGDWEGYEKHYVLHCCPLGKTGALVIPEGIRGICESAFSGCTGLTHIRIPEGVVEIGKAAFSGCRSLASVVLPDSLRRIDSCAFSGCVSLTHIEIPGRNTYISPFVFEGCTSLSGVVLPKGIIQICEGAFSGCVNLTRVEIPEGVVEIGRNAFSGCVNLTRVEIPESVVEIGRNAFSGCTGLSEVTIPKGISRIGSNAFSGCTSLRTAIPETGEDDWTEGDDYGEDAFYFAAEFEEDDSWEYGSEYPEDSPYEDEAGDCRWDRDGTGFIFSNREKQTLKSKPADNGQKGENMEKQERDLLTLEERLQYAAESRASSPEAALRMVRKFSEIPAGYFFCGAEDLDAMNELTGRFWEHPSVDVDTYHGFCQTFRLAIIYDTACRMRDQPEMVLSAEDCDHPCQPLWRADTVNAVVLLGLMLLDHAKGRGKNKDICHCMRMTLGQYLDALAEFTSGEEGMPGSSHTDFRLFGQRFLKSRDGSWTLGDALADILKRYIAAQQEFGRLDHILRCMDALCCCLEEQGGTQADSARQFREILGKYCPGLEGRKLMEEGGWYPDPYGHYLALAGAYPEDVPDPGREGLAPRAVRSQVFLPEYDCSPQSLRALAAQTPFRDFRELLEKNICEERMAHAMEEINASAVYLYTMWVEPYLPAEWSGF